LSRPHAGEQGQLDDQAITQFQHRKTFVYFFDSHHKLWPTLDVLRCHQEFSRILPKMTLGDRQTEHLMKIPPKMIDGAERQASSCLTLQEGLQLLSRDAVQFPLAELRVDMKLDAILNCHPRRAFPTPAMNYQVHVVNKILQQHLRVERDLTAVDGAYMFGDLVQRVGLRHL